MKTLKDVISAEEKGCITFSRICVNLGKVLNNETRKEEYYCSHDFPKDCSKFGCPHYMLITNRDDWYLREFSEKEAKKIMERGAVI